MRYQSLRRATRATLRLPPLKNDDRSLGDANSTEYDGNFFSSTKQYTSTGIMQGKNGRKVSLQHNHYYFNVHQNNHNHKFSSASVNVQNNFNRKMSEQSPSKTRRNSRQSLSVAPLTHLHSEKNSLNSNSDHQINNGKLSIIKLENNNNTIKKNNNNNVEIYVELNENSHLLRSPLKVIKSYVWRHGRNTRGKNNTSQNLSYINNDINNKNKKTRFLHSFTLKQQKMQNLNKKFAPEKVKVIINKPSNINNNNSNNKDNVDITNKKII